MVLQHIFKSFIDLEFIFVYGVSWWLKFIFLHVAVQISQDHLWGGYFLLHFMLPPACQILIDYRELGLFLGSLICSSGLCVCSSTSTRLFWLQCPCNTVWYQVWWSLLHFFLSQNCCSYLGSFMFPRKFLKCLFYICEIHHWYFNRDCIESINCLEQILLQRGHTEGPRDIWKMLSITSHQRDAY